MIQKPRSKLLSNLCTNTHQDVTTFKLMEWLIGKTDFFKNRM